MRASAIFSVLFSAVAVLAHGGHRGNMTDPGEWTTTEIVTQYTTYCPHPTTIVQNNQTYTITEATTLTITNCPCTLTKTYTTITETICPGGCVHPTETSIVKPTGHSNVTSTYVAPEPTIVQPNVTVGPTPPPFTGAAVSNNKVTLAGGALAALVGVAAYLL